MQKLLSLVGRAGWLINPGYCWLTGGQSQFLGLGGCGARIPGSSVGLLGGGVIS